MIDAEKQRMRSRIRELSLINPSGNSGRLLDALLGLEEWKRSSRVLLFAPLPGEPDPTLLEQYGDTRDFYFPRIEGGMLGLYRRRPESLWSSGPYGLLEPDPKTWERGSSKEPDLALVPGLAFDPQGGRLGRGKGFYDRLLGDPCFQALKVGLAWSWQITDEVPAELHDVAMDLVVTEERIIRPASMLDKPAESR